MINRRRVLVTRPQPGADRTAARLVKLGLDPIVLPLTQIATLPHEVPDLLPDLVVATSPQAFRYLSASVATTLAHASVMVTGKATAAAARKAGFLTVTESGGDVSALIASLSSAIKPHEHILYLAGRVRRPELEQHMAATGTALSVTEVYDTIPVSYSTEKILALTADGQLGAVLLTSVTCANLLVEIATAPEHSQHFENVRIICLSARIATVAERRFLNHVTVAPATTEDALLECLVAALSWD